MDLPIFFNSKEDQTKVAYQGYIYDRKPDGAPLSHCKCEIGTCQACIVLLQNRVQEQSRQDHDHAPYPASQRLIPSRNGRLDVRAKMVLPEAGGKLKMAESKETTEGVKRSTSYDSLLYLRAARRIPRSRSIASFQPRTIPDSVCSDIFHNGRYYPKWLHHEYHDDRHSWDKYWLGVKSYFGSQCSPQFNYNNYYPSYKYNSSGQMPFSWYLSYRPPQFGYPYFGTYTNSSLYGMIGQRHYRAAYPYTQWHGQCRSDLFNEPTLGISLTRQGTLAPDIYGSTYLRSHYQPVRYRPSQYYEFDEPVKMLRPRNYSYNAAGWPRAINYHIQGFYE